MSNNDLIQFLKLNHFVACAEHSLPEMGMNSQVDAFSNDKILLRIVVDRGQRFIDLANPATVVWVDIFKLASMVDLEFHPKTGSFGEAVRVLTTYWTGLAVLELP